MNVKINMTLSALILALLLPAGAAMAEGSLVTSDRGLHPTLEQGLDRDRAAHRALMLEERRVEEDSRRAGAGLDRDRAEMRAEKMAERRHQHYN